jgi:predicted dinucleotide-binding enzyme
MNIGILGSGLMGGKLGTLFARAGHDVVFSYARSQEKLKGLARDAGGRARPGTPREAAQEADVLLLAVHWSRIDDVLKQAGHLVGKLILTCTLPMNADDTELVVAHTSSGAEELARRASGTRLVAAFNTVPSEVLFSVFEGRGNASRPSLVYCGDDARGKETRRPADQRRRVRSGGRGATAHRPIHGAVRPACRAARIRGRRRAGARLPIRAF